MILRVLLSQAPKRLRPWEALELLIDDFVATHGQLENREPLVLVRDDYRCQVPCTRSVVEVHHIGFKSAGGTEERHNETCVCPHHHRNGIHTGRLQLTGSAPLELNWVFRLQPGGKAFAHYKNQQQVWPRPKPWKPAAA